MFASATAPTTAKSKLFSLTWYVDAGHVRLGYAHTIAGCQGLTVGAPGRRPGTAHALLTADATRNELYVAITRGVTANHAYLQSGGGTDPHQVITPEAIEPPTTHELFIAIVGRDGSATSATSEYRDADDPHRLLGQACDAYADAVLQSAETSLPPGRLDQLTRAAEEAVPHITAAPAWDTLRAHLAVLTIHGRDAAGDLRAAAQARTLDTSRDSAAVLDYRLDATGNHSLGDGPLPWLPATPHNQRPEWTTYLAARASRVRYLTEAVREDVSNWTTDTAPTWAQPYLTDLALVEDLAIWRAAQSTAQADLRPAGERPRRIAHIRQHQDLTKRCLQVAGTAEDGAERWAQTIKTDGADITGDDYWPILAARLNLAESAGLPVRRLLASAITQRPLPAENPATALWWRLAPHLAGLTSPTDPRRHRIRPTWTDRITAQLGSDRTDRLVLDRLWPVLVARVDQATSDGLDPAKLVEDAASQLAAHINTLPPHELATVLLWHIGHLADPDPVAPGDNLDPDVPPDPADADLIPPPDMYDETPDFAPTPADRGDQLDDRATERTVV